MAITINGTGSITGLSTGGLPDGSVDADTLATDSVTAAKLKSDAIATGDLPTGSILQVKQTVKRGIISQAFSTTNTYQDISGMSVSITPVAADSNFLVSCVVHCSNTTTATVHFRLARGTDDTIFYADQSPNGSNCLRDTFMFRPASTPYGFDQGNVGTAFLDDPTYTLGDSLTYKLRWTLGATYNGTAYLNRAYDNTNNDYNPTSTSHITVMEVAG